MANLQFLYDSIGVTHEFSVIKSAAFLEAQVHGFKFLLIILLLLVPKD